ncbi:MAG TPA: hypothetical protein PKZ84_10350 [Anaerolineae bacterium]|nr:hypothetical protein [Anaerolineae bacterium]HQI84967.1 hypothetical protein [Anaerolineae bacterium]
MVPDVLYPVLFVFAGLAGTGFILSLISHGAALLGLNGPLGDSTWLLHIGIFVVWTPAMLVSQITTAGVQPKDRWKAALRNCPPWMKYMVYGFFGYALVNFLLFALAAPEASSEGAMPPAVVRGFSGHWMLFYLLAFAVLYSAAQSHGQPRRCPNGHIVGPVAEFCERCGQRIIEVRTEKRRLE